MDELVRSREVPSDESNAIRAFYQSRLSRIEREEAKIAEEVAIERLIRTIRHEAQEGKYREAIRSLKAVAHQHRGAFPFDAMMAEVVQRASREEADKLVTQAKSFLAQGQIEEAHQKLLRASGVDPSHVSARNELAALEAKLTAVKQADAVPPSPVSSDDEVVTATLVEASVPDEPIEVIEPIEVSEAGIEARSDEAEVVAPPLAPTTVEALPAAPQLAAASVVSESPSSEVLATPAMPTQASPSSGRRFADTEEEVPNPTHRLIDAASQWSTVLKPFLIDNVLWFVGAFLVIAGFVVLIVTFWGNIEQNRILMHSLVYFSLTITTGMFFAMAYFMRIKYPQLENSSNVLLTIVVLLIPLVFAAAALTTLVPVAPTDIVIQASMR